MAVVGTLMVLVGVNNAPLAAGLASSQAQLKGFAGAGSAALNALKTAAVGVGIATVAGLALGVRAAASFQEQMATVNTIARLTPDALTDIGEQIRALSVQSGTALPDLTGAFYDLLSVGVPVGQAMEFLANANTLAIGGLSTTNEAVNAITTAINSWGIATGAAKLTMADSAKVMDIFAKTVEIGGLTAAEIPSALANVASSAAALNVPLEEVGAAWAILTTRGFSASEAATSMDAALSALQKRPPGMEKLEKATGKSYEAIARTQGAQAAMQALVTDAKKFGIQLVDVFGRKEALGYARNITDVGAPAFKKALAAMLNPTGTASGQAAERMGTFNRQLDIFGASINDLFISLGTRLLPPLTSFVQGVNEGIQSVGAWVASGQQLASTFMPVINTIVAKFQELIPVAQGIGEVILDLATRVWEGGLNKAMSTAVMVIGSVIDVVRGIGEAILKNEDAMNILRTVGDLIGAGFGLAADAVDTLLGFLGRLGDSIRGNEEAMRTLASIGDSIARAFDEAGPYIQEVIDAIQMAIDLAGQAAEKVATLLGTESGKPPTDRGSELPQSSLFADLPWPLGPKNTPNVDIGPFRNVLGGDSTSRPPIQLNNTTVINVDGQKFTELNDRRQFNNASQYNSGFNGGELP